MSSIGEEARETLAKCFPEPSPWHHPRGSKNMPSPGQRVFAIFEDCDTPVLATPIHADGSHMIDGKSVYLPVVAWTEVPEL